MPTLAGEGTVHADDDERACWRLRNRINNSHTGNAFVGDLRLSHFYSQLHVAIRLSAARELLPYYLEPLNKPPILVLVSAVRCSQFSTHTFPSVHK